MLCAVGVVFIAILIIKDPITAAIVSLNVFLITFNLVGVNLICLKKKVMWMLNEIIPNSMNFIIEVNAISVVNLITAVGLAVEFCVHSVIMFMREEGTKK